MSRSSAEARRADDDDCSTPQSRTSFRDDPAVAQIAAALLDMTRTEPVRPTGPSWPSWEGPAPTRVVLPAADRPVPESNPPKQIDRVTPERVAADTATTRSSRSSVDHQAHRKSAEEIAVEAKDLISRLPAEWAPPTEVSESRVRGGGGVVGDRGEAQRARRAEVRREQELIKADMAQRRSSCRGATAVPSGVERALLIVLVLFLIALVVVGAWLLLFADGTL